MKNFKFLETICLLVVLIIFSSCSKEEKIEKNLWNKGGEWNIQSLVVNQFSTNPADNYNETIYNCGTFIFREDRSGNYTITIDGDVESGTFNYYNTEYKLTFVINTEARIFDILDWNKGKMTILISDNYTSNSHTVSYTETLHLVKRKF